MTTEQQEITNYDVDELLIPSYICEDVVKRFGTHCAIVETRGIQTRKNRDGADYQRLFLGITLAKDSQKRIFEYMPDKDTLIHLADVSGTTDSTKWPGLKGQLMPKKRGDKIGYGIAVFSEGEQ